LPKNNKSKAQLPKTAGKFLDLLRRTFTLNIGTLLFGVLFLYMLFSAVVYLTSTHYSTYQVISGPLSRNETYTGLALREETVVSSDQTGYISYYAREGMKINATGAVYGISPNQTITDVKPLSQSDLSKIRKQMSSFSNGFSLGNFNDTYSFKYELEGNILQYASGAAQVPSSNAQAEGEEGDSEEEGDGEISAPIQPSAVTLGSQTLCSAPADGIVLYSKDGYEGKTVDDLTTEDFDQNSYQKTDLKTQDSVKTGQDIYTIITDERWSLLIPLSERQAAKLADRTSIKVNFLKDGISQMGDFEMMEIDGKTYGKLDFNKGLIRYSSDRFLDIELVTNSQSGLKIPLSSIVSKDFYVIPEDYATLGGNSNNIGFLQQKKNADSTEFVSPTIYGLKDGNYYVEKSSFRDGDILIQADSSARYTIGETDVLEGVFSTNKGYPVFRNIMILDQNEEFAIVEKGTAYGLARYDFIVQDASKVKEEDIVK
jgi:hypothetical protein